MGKNRTIRVYVSNFNISGRTNLPLIPSKRGRRKKYDKIRSAGR